MASHKSAIKRQRQSLKRQERNRSVKSTLKTLAKKVETAVAAKSGETAKEALARAMHAYDKAASAGVIHRNTASRKISRLSAKVRKTGAA